MTTPHETSGDVEQLQADVEKARDQLGQTVDALSARLDVRSRARIRLGEVKMLAARRVGEARQKTASLVAGTRQRATAPAATGAKHAATDGRGTVLTVAVPAAAAVVASALVVWRVRHR